MLFLHGKLFVCIQQCEVLEGGEERRVRGHHAYRQFLQGYKGSFTNLQRHSVSPRAIDRGESSYGAHMSPFNRSSSMEIPQRNANSLGEGRNSMSVIS